MTKKNHLKKTLFFLLLIAGFVRLDAQITFGQADRSGLAYEIQQLKQANGDDNGRLCSTRKQNL